MQEISDKQLLLYREALKQELYAKAREDFLTFVKLMMPSFVEAPHHKLMTDLCMGVESSELDRLMLFLPPRSSKSLVGNKLFVTWCLGKHPDWEIIGVSHSQTFAEGVSEEIRDYIESETFQKIFPECQLATNAKGRERWRTTRGGVYKAAGAGTKIAGIGGDLVILDDVVSEQTAYSDIERNKINAWYPSGLRTRLQPGARILVINTRWHEDDLSGHLLSLAQRESLADQWVVYRIPALLDEAAAQLLDLEEGETYFPGWWSTEDLLRTRASLTDRDWEAQYMQEPSNPEGSILGADTWNRHEGELPEFQFTFFSLDTAFSEKTTADFSVIQVWGVFFVKGQQHTMLIDQRKGRWSFPDLKEEVTEIYWKYKPDIVLVENKASGQSLIQELRLLRLPVQPIDLKRMGKIQRAHTAAPSFEGGIVHIKDHGDPWVWEVIRECAQFPTGKHDDIVDATTQAINWLRNTGLLELCDDYILDEDANQDIADAAPTRFYI